MAHAHDHGHSHAPSREVERGHSRLLEERNTTLQVDHEAAEQPPLQIDVTPEARR